MTSVKMNEIFLGKLSSTAQISRDGERITSVVGLFKDAGY
jgi:hypothetical protein